MKHRLLFLGPPGAGKGTQAEILCKANGLDHLSTGDLLRSEVAAGSSLGKQASEVMNRGELVSDQLVLALVKKRLSCENHGWLLDGFPRNVTQAESLESLLNEICQPIEAVVLLKLDDEFIIKRLLSRGRIDDNEEVIRHRLYVYREKTEPLIEYYSNKELIRVVSAEGSIDSIGNRILEALNG